MRIACLLAALALGCSFEAEDEGAPDLAGDGKADWAGSGLASPPIALCGDNAWSGVYCPDLAKTMGWSVLWPYPRRAESTPNEISGTIADPKQVDRYRFYLNCADVRPGLSLQATVAPTPQDRVGLDTAMTIRDGLGQVIAEVDDNSCWVDGVYDSCLNKTEDYRLTSALLQALGCSFELDVSGTPATFTTRERTGTYRIWFFIGLD